MYSALQAVYNMRPDESEQLISSSHQTLTRRDLRVLQSKMWLMDEVRGGKWGCCKRRGVHLVLTPAYSTLAALLLPTAFNNAYALLSPSSLLLLCVYSLTTT